MAVIIHLFPLWAILLSAVAYALPAPFIELKSSIIPLLTVIMFSMGLTLKLDDFKRALAMPGLITAGLVLQYSVMPATALLVTSVFGLEAALVTGFILLGSSPGGTASNVITYLAGGNVALSITLTSISTILAVLLTPWLTFLLADTSIDVPVMKMLVNILYMVIFPVSLGIVLRHFYASQIQGISQLLPLVAVTAIVVIIAIITALNKDNLGQTGLLVAAAVIAHNAIGLMAGYFTASLLGFEPAEGRTLAIEVGMQNSGLAVALAIKHFSAAAALPGALFSIWHNISGSILAFFWSKKTASMQ